MSVKGLAVSGKADLGNEPQRALVTQPTLQERKQKCSKGLGNSSFNILAKATPVLLMPPFPLECEVS